MMMELVGLVLAYLSYVITPLCGSPCPAPDWLFHQESNRCFYLKDIADLSFFEAQQYCRKVGFVMAMTKTDDVLELIAGKYKSQGDVWVGATDASSKGKPSWSDGTSFSQTSLWDTGYPKKQNSRDQCIYLSMESKKLRDRSCYDRQLKTLCQESEVSDCVSSPEKCEQKCIDIGLKSSKCECEPGYKLVKGTKCEDINECEFQNGGCEHKCNNTVGSYQCSCTNGKSMLGGRVCKGNEEEQGLMTMELVSIIITVAFPAISIMGCILMALWRKKRIEEATKDKVEEEIPVEEEHVDEGENYDENYEEEADEEPAEETV